MIVELSTLVMVLVFIATQLAPREEGTGAISLTHKEGTLCEFGVIAGQVGIVLLAVQTLLMLYRIYWTKTAASLLALAFCLSLLNPRVATLRLMPAFVTQAVLVYLIHQNVKIEI